MEIFNVKNKKLILHYVIIVTAKSYTTAHKHFCSNSSGFKYTAGRPHPAGRGGQGQGGVQGCAVLPHQQTQSHTVYSE